MSCDINVASTACASEAFAVIEKKLVEGISVFACMWPLQSTSPQFGAVLHIPPVCTCCLILTDCTTTYLSTHCKKSMSMQDLITCVVSPAGIVWPCGLGVN